MRRVSVCSVIFSLSFGVVVLSSYDTGDCEPHPQVGHILLGTSSLKDGENKIPRNFNAVTVYSWKYSSTANCVGLWQTVRYYTHALLCPHGTSQFTQLGFGVCCIHNPLSSVYAVEATILLCNLYIIMCCSCRQLFLYTVLWHNIFFALAKRMWWLQERTLGKINFSAQ